RNPTDERPKPGPSRRRNTISELLAGSKPVQWLIEKAVDLRPGIAPLGLDLALRGIKDHEYVNVSYKVFNIGRANDNRAYSSEIGVPVARAHEAVERIFALAQRHAELGAVYHTSPISLRFVKASPALMAMQYGEPTMMIELIQLVDTHGGYELLAAYEDELYELGGRPHWGQFNTLTNDDERLAKLYPRYADWRAVRDELAGSGVFDAPFTKRVGISATSTAVERP
ncbi:MAG TPA: D-arabinono-1,4-lactone oxidase, partial [Thermoleophilaceae bacterium]